MKRRYKILIGCAVLLALLTGAAVFMLETNAGLRLVAGLAERHFGKALTVGSIDGRLAGPLEIRNLRLVLADATVEIGELDLDWQPTALLRGQLRFASVRASAVKATFSTSGESSGQFALPSSVRVPLSLSVAKLRIDNLDLRTRDHDLRFATLTLALYANDRRIGIRRLDARGPLLDLAGHLQTDPYGDWKMQAALAWTLRPAGYPPVSGSTEVKGALRREIRLHQSLSGPLVARLDAKIQNPFNSISWNGHLEIERLNPHALRDNWPALKATAILETSGNLHDIRATGTLGIAAAETYAAHLDLDAGLEPDKVLVRRLLLAQIGGPVRLNGSGSVTTGPAMTADLALSWRNLHWPLADATPLLASPQGEARIEGRLNDWQAMLHARVAVRDLPASDWTLTAGGTSEAITIRQAKGRWLGGTLAASGRLGLSDPLPFRLKAKVRDLHTESLDSQWHGTASFDLAARGGLNPLLAQLTVNGFSGKLNGRGLGGSAAVAYTDGLLRIDSAQLTVGKNRLQASGRWAQTLRFDWRLDAPDLAAFDPELGGSVAASGNLSGSPPYPRLSGSLSGEKLYWQAVSAGAVQSTFDLALRGGAASSFAVQLHDVQRDGMSLSAVTAELGGPAEDQHFTARIDSSQAQLTLAAEGALANNRWSGRIVTATLAPARGPSLSLEAPAEVVIGPQVLALGNACWTGAETAHLCLSAKSEANGWTLQAALQDLPLDIANPFLPEGLELGGTLDASLQGSGGGGRLSIRVEAHSGGLEVSRAIAGERQYLHVTQLAVKAQADEALATARIDAALEDGGTLTADARIPWRANEEPAGSLHIKAHLPDLSGLAALSSQVTAVAGRLDADLDLAGGPHALHAEGTARLEDGAFTLVRTGTRMRNVSADLKGTNQGISFQAQASDADGGRLAATGAVTRQASGWALASRVEGDKFRALDIPEARVTVSPDLTVDVQDYTVRVKGSVTVPSAQLKPPDFSGAVAPTPDLVVVGREQPAATPRWKTYADVEVRLGDNVHFTGYGLTARIGGGVRLNDTPGKITTGSGELNVRDGSYKAYGQVLTIERGRLLFSGGAVDNPGLDIRATRTTGLVVAGLLVTGTLRNPKLQIFSDPPMSQSNALAYLLFGHGIQQTSGSEQSTFNQAASALGIAGGTYVVRSVGKHVGVQTVSVENASPYNTGSNQASLFLGRYLSPRVYVSYGIGLYAPINLFRVRYELSRHWAIEAESGTISGADILYNIEH